MASRPLIVGIGGTTRKGSTSELALAAALAHAAVLGCDTEAFGSGALPAEPYDPARPERSPRAQALILALRRADGLIIATPSYHGGISGLVKNAIDFIEDMRGDQPAYLQGRAVGCIVCADGAQAMGSTLSSMRDVIHALRGWPTPYGAAINSLARPFGQQGGPVDPAVAQACRTVAEEVVAFARMVAAQGDRALWPGAASR